MMTKKRRITAYKESENVMTKKEMLKEMIIMLKLKNHHCNYGLGVRSDTSDDVNVRCKDIRAFFVDLFEEEDKEVKELLRLLEDEIRINAHGQGAKYEK